MVCTHSSSLGLCEGLVFSAPQEWIRLRLGFSAAVRFYLLDLLLSFTPNPLCPQAHGFLLNPFICTPKGLPFISEPWIKAEGSSCWIESPLQSHSSKPVKSHIELRGLCISLPHDLGCGRLKNATSPRKPCPHLWNEGRLLVWQRGL